MEGDEDKNIELSEDSKNLANGIVFIMTNSDKKIEILKKPTLQEWMKFIEEEIAPNRVPVPENLIRKKLDEIAALQKVKETYPQNFRFCLTIIPCDRFGHSYNEIEISDGEHLTMIVLAPPSIEEKNAFFQIQRNLHNFMPEEIQKNCTFDIGEYTEKPNSPYTVGANERTQLVTKYALALKNLQFLCNQYFKKT